MRPVEQEVLKSAQRSVAGAVRADEGGRARIRNPWGQGERLRTELLEAAARLLGELESVEGLTLRGIAREAGVSPASVYSHFADKSALVSALLEYEHGRVLELLAQAGSTASPGDPIGPVRAQLHAFCRTRWPTAATTG